MGTQWEESSRAIGFIYGFAWGAICSEGRISTPHGNAREETYIARIGAPHVALPTTKLWRFALNFLLVLVLVVSGDGSPS
jgi:hypothetical protein